MRKKIIGIIPARMGSSRFPGKPLAALNGIPLIGHVYLRSAMSSLLDEVYIATCDKQIMDYAKSISAKAVMTKSSHQRASDRCAEAMLKIEKASGSQVDIVVMIQGDEPMITPEMIDLSVKPFFKDKTVQVTNLMAKIISRQEHDDPNTVKVVVDAQSNALYFSREPIPSWKKGAVKVPMMKQVCIIPFRREFLIHFNRLKPRILEQVESVDMLRVLEYGDKVRMVFSDALTQSVDTLADLRKVEKMLKNDPLIKKYT